VLETLKGLRFDHGAHLRQHPNETAGFRVIEFLGSRRAIDARGLGYASRVGRSNVSAKNRSVNLGPGVLALLLALGSGALLAQQSPRPPQKQEQTQPSRPEQPLSTQQQAAPQPPIVVNVLPSPKTEKELAEERHERDEKAKLDKRLVDLTAELSEYTGGLFRATVGLVLATGLLVIVTAGLVVFAYLQSRDMKASIGVAGKSAKAAEDSAATADKALRTTQRAYLSVEPLGIMPSADRKHVISHIEIRNVGHLPAKNVSWRMNVTPSLDNTLSVFNVDESEARGSTVIFPETKATRGSEQTPIGEAPLPSKAEGKQGHIYVWGAVYYDNGLGEDCWTKFCHRYPRAREMRPENGGVSIDKEHARYHEYGNDAK
jgi:hypothetical protein